MMENRCYPFVNTPLPYAEEALEPFIDGLTMHLHHDRHLQTYIDDLNTLLLAQPSLRQRSLCQLLRMAPRLPSTVGVPLSRAAGGVYNHRFFFESMTPDGTQWPSGALSRALARQFGGFEAFWRAFQKAALSVFGSGYAWLCGDGRGRLLICTTANQECPITRGLCPLLTVDVWEHAYYLKHYNERAAYLTDFRRVVDWQRVAARYAEWAR